MRRQVSVLVAVVATAIVVSFVIPLMLLVRTLAEDRGMAVATGQANSVAVLVSGLHDQPNLADVLNQNLARSAVKTSVVLADGQVLGSSWPDALTDPGYQQAAAGQAFSVQNSDGAQVYVPAVVDTGVVVVRCSLTPAQLSEGVPLAWASIIGLGVLLSVIAVAVAAQMGRRVSRPLLDVAETAHRLREGDLDARAPLVGTDETVELGTALNGLADRIEELLAAERDNVGSLAHRLRTPITALRLEVEQVANPQLRESLTESVAQLQVAIDDVVREARRPLREGLPGTCDAVALVASRADYWRPLAEDQAREFQVGLPLGPLRVGMSSLQLGDVVDICIDNVFAHTEEGVNFALHLSREDDQALLVVSDDGPGFPAAPTPTRPGTTGMGLRIARRLVAGAGGTLTISPPGSPSSVRIELRLQGR
ncbi:MAG TPA: two-component sensor histidine kinase [Propionibacteriaceae bacterium]|nr:two-component sensor histidine kinase [Propionibacteriaceae bacterium]